MPQAVAYPGAAYHVACAMHAHAQRTRSTTAPAKWRRLLDALAQMPAAESGGNDAATAPLLDGLAQVLSRGDPGLDARLLDAVARPYGCAPDLLTLPDEVLAADNA